MTDDTGSALAPIVVFAFNRPDHLQQTLSALVACAEARKSELHVFIDGPKSLLDKRKVRQVHDVAKAASGGFRSCNIVTRPVNVGLAENIITGVSGVIGERGRVIVLEDDIVVSPDFLTVMNAALAEYATDTRVWHISAHTIINDTSAPDAFFFWRVMNCWGWATWADRWAHYARDPQRIVDSFTPDDIHAFNLDGHYDFWSQVLANARGDIKTWAVFWYATIFLNKGLCLNPKLSFARNVGFDGTGVHCGSDLSFQEGQDLNPGGVFIAPAEVAEDREMVEKVKDHYRAAAAVPRRRNYTPKILRNVKLPAALRGGRRK
jgi:hypothetical protein